MSLWLAHHSTGPAQKAAQAGEFKRRASEVRGVDKVLARDINQRILRLALSIVFLVSSHIAVAAQSALEEEIVTISRALSPSVPTSNGKGSFLLGSQSKGKTLEVRVKIAPDLKDWRGFWRNNVCSDLSTRRILAMGGTVAIQAQVSDNKPREILTINPSTCRVQGKAISSADAPLRSAITPAPSPEPVPK